MSRDQRVARFGGEPTKDGPAGAERWVGYLDSVRSDVAAKVASLSYDAQRTSQVPSGWTPLELLSHVLHMEQRWFVWGFLGEQVEEPWGDWNTDEPWRSDDSDETLPAARWVVADDVTVEALVLRLDTVGARTREILSTSPLDAVAAPGGRFAADPPTLEWICFHVLAEYSRHAGHLDIVAELVGD